MRARVAYTALPDSGDGREGVALGVAGDTNLPSEGERVGFGFYIPSRHLSFDVHIVPYTICSCQNSRGVIPDPHSLPVNNYSKIYIFRC